MSKGRQGAKKVRSEQGGGSLRQFVVDVVFFRGNLKKTTKAWFCSPKQINYAYQIIIANFTIRIISAFDFN